MVETTDITLRLPIPIAGQRVILRHDVDRFPDFIAPTGSIGRVIQSVGYIAVQIEERYWTDGMESHGGEVHWYDGVSSHANGFPVPGLLDFHLDVHVSKADAERNLSACR